MIKCQIKTIDGDFQKLLEDSNNSTILSLNYYDDDVEITNFINLKSLDINICRRIFPRITKYEACVELYIRLDESFWCLLRLAKNHICISIVEPMGDEGYWDPNYIKFIGHGDPSNLHNNIDVREENMEYYNNIPSVKNFISHNEKLFNFDGDFRDLISEKKAILSEIVDINSPIMKFMFID